MLRLARVINYNPEIPEQYPFRWWLVLAAALVPARGLVWIAGVFLGPAATALLPLFWLALVRIHFGGRARKMRETLFRQFPDALAMLVRAVRVGVPVTEGIRAASRESPEPTAAIFGRVADELAIGVSIEDALRSVTRRYGLAEYRFFATALALQSQTGGGLSETLENLADTIRKRVAAQAKGKALAAEARMSSAVLAVLPLITMAGLTALNLEYVGRLTTDPRGRYIIAAAMLTEGLGLASMRFLIQRALS
jgi:tight adherence protein B